MSTIKVDTIQNTSGASVIKVDAIQTTSGIVMATIPIWSNLNGTGTIAARDNQGISSYSDIGTGSYVHNFSNNMSNSNYCWKLTVDYRCAVARNNNIGGDSGAQSTGSITLYTYGLSSSSADDFDTINMCILGDM